jgi:hypothetical protein
MPAASIFALILSVLWIQPTGEVSIFCRRDPAGSGPGRRTQGS